MHDARARERRGPAVRLPRQVEEVTGLFLALVDEAAPGLVEGLYLHGSLAFGEWYDGRSDIDYVAVLADRADDTVVDLLRDVHGRVAETFPWPPYDGFHLSWDDLAHSPYACPDLPCTQAGLFHEDARLDVHPVTWHELAERGIRVRGPALDDVEIWTDQAVLRAYTHANLAEYWAAEVEQLRRFPAEAARPEAAAWYVLGISRVHHLLATDRLTSKDGAGRYAVDTFGERWRLVVADALTYRATGEPTGALGDHARGRQVIGFAETVVADGLTIAV